MDRRILPAAPGPGPSTAKFTPYDDDEGGRGKRRVRKDEDEDALGEDGGRKKKKTKRRKVDHACVYCRRSHMTCDAGRPCQRCIKREIGHLCHDEVKPSPAASVHQAPKEPARDSPQALAPPPPQPADSFPGSEAAPMSFTMPPASAPAPASVPVWPALPQPGFAYPARGAGNEFSVLTDFLQSLDDRSFFGTPPTMIAESAPAPAPPPNAAPDIAPPPQASPSPDPDPEPVSPILPAATKAEQFLLTAADQAPGSRDERLARVIHSKYEAGLLKPYNYVKGYARLSRWMDRNVSQESKQQILGPLSVLRPKFRAIAQSLTDIDLVFIEEAFERLLLDYDRVFSAMGIPACLWRRTGEIYKGNREFAELVGVEGHMLREGRLCIYELMAEESAVNYWEKYGHVAFDTGQKAVLTSCVLRYKPNLIGNTTSAQMSPVVGYNKRLQTQTQGRREEGLINCCFSFTIRRDTWGIPSMIVGNFIRH